MTGRRARRPADKAAGKEKSGLPNLAVEDEAIDLTNTNIRAASRPPPSSKRDRPFLVAIAGANAGEMYPLRQAEVVVGRSPLATVHIDDDSISRQHAKLTVGEGEVHVEDSKSANGTFVNGEKLTTRRLLKDGDKLALGPTYILRFTLGDELEVVFQRKMREAALRDGLTGAYNKRYLVERLQTELAFAQRHRTQLSLIMLDLDHFKNINDTFGHPAGDEVLVALARVVQTTIRKEDVFARYGGEEFVVLCRSANAVEAVVLAERLRASESQHWSSSTRASAFRSRRASASRAFQKPRQGARRSSSGPRTARSTKPSGAGETGS